MIREILKYDEPKLKMTCDEVPSVEKAEPVIKDLIDTLEDTHNGVGLAASQIGELVRILVYRTSLKGTIRVMVNPKLYESSNGYQSFDEGCLSYPNFYTKIMRPKRIKISYLDRYGKIYCLSFRGFEALIIQHEMDHLDGICLVGNEWRKQNADLSNRHRDKDGVGDQARQAEA